MAPTQAETGNCAFPFQPHLPQYLFSMSSSSQNDIVPPDDHAFHASSSFWLLLPPPSSPQMLLRGSIPTPLRLRPRASTLPRSLPASSSASFSITDGELKSRGFRLRRSVEGLNVDQLNSVFVAVGFPRRDPERIRVALEHTDALVWLEYGEETPPAALRRPVAFARATGDGVFNAIIWDVVVDPSFQGIGLGRAVMERLLHQLLAEKGITNIALYSEPRVLGFYRTLGFVADPDGIRGMVYSTTQKRRV